MGWGFPIFYSTKNKVFTSNEQTSIDKICRNLNKFTKKKFTIDFSIEVNEDYGGYISNFIYENDIRVQTMSYTYNFEFLKFYTRIIKLWATNKKQSETMLQWASEKWDYFFQYEGKYTEPGALPKSFKVKDINGIEAITIAYLTPEGEKKKIKKPYFHEMNYDIGSDSGKNHILISYNSNWQKQLEDIMKKKFEHMVKNV